MILRYNNAIFRCEYLFISLAIKRDRVMPQEKHFIVVDGPLAVRDKPLGNLIAKLITGTEVRVSIHSRIEKGNFIWWQHQDGWSAEMKVDPPNVFMKELANPAQLQASTPQNGIDHEQPSEIPDILVFQVIDGPLSVRDKPHGQFIDRIPQGHRVAVVPNSRKEEGHYIWWKHDLGWSAERNINGDTVFMQQVDVAFESPEEDKPKRPVQIEQVRVLPTGVPIHRLPTTYSPLSGTLHPDTVLEVDLNSRTATNGYVWLEHQQGWSPEQTTDGDTIFLQIVEEESKVITPVVDPELTVRIDTSAMNPEDWDVLEYLDELMDDNTVPAARDYQADTKPIQPVSITPVIHHLKTTQWLTVYDKPSLEATPHAERIAPGEVVRFDAQTIQEVDSLIWVEHEQGWSTWKSTDDAIVYLTELDSIEDLLPNSDARPDINSLPASGALFNTLPVRLHEIMWFRYYGNTVHAFNNGDQLGYNTYSQGLQPGLDFGNSSARGIEVFAGIHGTFIQTVRRTDQDQQIWIQQGDYMLIYRHIQNPVRMRFGEPVEPNTQIAQIHPSPGLNHVRLEVHYQEKWLINPLLLMTDTMVNALTKRFPPDKSRARHQSNLYHFFRSAEWKQWTTPLDQPILELYQAIIGPRSDQSQVG